MPGFASSALLCRGMWSRDSAGPWDGRARAQGPSYTFVPTCTRSMDAVAQGTGPSSWLTWEVSSRGAAAGQVLGTAQGGHRCHRRGIVAEARGPAKPGLHGAAVLGGLPTVPLHNGCRKARGTRLAAVSGIPTSDTRSLTFASQGQNIPAPRATHPLPVTTSLLRNAHGHVAQQPDASALLSSSLLPAAPAEPGAQRPCASWFCRRAALSS